MHLRWDEALGRLLEPPPPTAHGGEPIHEILIDPQGLASGYRRTLVVGVTNDVTTGLYEDYEAVKAGVTMP